MSDELYYRVGPAIWLEDWDDDTRYAAFYLLTCRHRTTEGLFYMPLPYAVADLGWTTKRFKRAFHELQRTGFIAYDQDASVCLITKAMKWQGGHNVNQVKHALKVLEKVPATPLRARFRMLAETYSPSLAKGLAEGFGEGLGDSLCSSSSSTKNVSSTSERKRASVDVEPTNKRVAA